MEGALPGNVVGSGLGIRKGKVLILTVSLNPKNLLMNESIPYFANSKCTIPALDER